MSQRIVYANGRYLNASKARVSIFDRGFLFADGVYEVTAVIRRHLIDFEAHLARLERSLAALEIPAPASRMEIVEIQERLIDENNIEEGTVYLQVTRGAAERDFTYPKHPTPSLVAFTYARQLIETPASRTGIRVITLPDVRWQRRDIKTIGLLPASMAKQAAVRRGADDAWMVQNGLVTEGSSNNAYIVNVKGEIVTRPLSNEILAGITRNTVLGLSREHGFPVVEKPFSVEDAKQAREAFITSISTFVCPVVQIDERVIADGRPGPVTMQLRALYIERAVHAVAGGTDAA